MRRTALILLLFATVLPAWGQTKSFSGVVTDSGSGEPLEFVTVLVKATEQWAITDEKGRFTISGIRTPGSPVEVSSLGYVTVTKDVKFTGEKTVLNFKLAEDNLTLESAVVTAQENTNAATTSRTIDKTALDHVQLMNVSDIAAMLPGGASTNPSLTSDQQISIRSGTGESGSSTFGTAIEVDGVRISNNASFTSSDLNGRSGSVKGASTNNIASSNIESVEVISGVPSVEYGDMTSGVVKINTKKGKTPWSVTMSTSPKTKQVSFGKGFGLGKTAGGHPIGILNASAEYTRSVSDPMSPYTSYDRKQVSLTYSNLFNRGPFASKPLRLSVSATGNLGGLDNKADPDKMVGTFLTRKDNAARVSLDVNWLLSKSWITNVELVASAAYGNKSERENTRKLYTSTATALHATEKGYYLSSPYTSGGNYNAVLVNKGDVYNIMNVDDRPFNTKVTLKANWTRAFGKVNNKVKVGADWATDKNFGVGQYTDDMSTAPSYREWRFCDVPSMHNVGIYAEDNFMLNFNEDSHLNLIAGVREDITLLPGSVYGTTSSLSPRFNAKYTAFTPKTHDKAFVRELAVRASWGVAVKQPSFSVLYPTPSYMDEKIFESTGDANNVIHQAYFVMPRTIEYNSALRWQRNRQAEIGLEMDLAGNRISLAAFRAETVDAYNKGTGYEGVSYNKTTQESVQGLPIPAEDRIYSLNPADGTITVIDRTGTIKDPINAPYTKVKQLVTRYYEDNDENPVRRYGLEWVIDFKRIRPINTTIRLDGSWYCYRAIYTNITQSTPTAQNGYDGTPFKYIGWYVGGNGHSNGSETSTVKTNLTITTHIPKVRMIVSVKLESCLYRYSRSLSENADGSARSKVLAKRDDRTTFTDASVYDAPCYSVTWPAYYSTYEDPNTPIPFAEAFIAAKQNNNTALYNDLSKLVVENVTYNYTFLKDYISPYFCANLSITKEIGDIASISFYANNFFNNSALIYSSKSGNWNAASTYIPSFYYGLTLRLKF